MEEKLNNLLNIIFKAYNINTLTNYQKRKIVFTYLANNITYDLELLNQIKNKTAKRDHKKEILDVLDNNKGICNAIAQVYMLLLEKLGIESIFICCDDSTEVYHQLNLVKEDNNFTFDDVTYAIFSEDKLERFDYTVEKANEFGHGLKKVYDMDYWIIIPPSFAHAVLGEDVTDNIDDFIEFVNNINNIKRI